MKTDLNIDVVKKIIDSYARAWQTQDPSLIVKIFTKDATYLEDVFEKPYTGHEEIKEYWKKRIVGEENDIKFKLINLYIDGDVVIAEWKVDLLYRNKPVILKEVAILEIYEGKIKSLREYWHSKTL